MKADQSGESGNDRVVRFREWSEVLEATALAPALKAVYRQEIVAFLRFCEVHHAGASIIVVKQYLAVAETQGRIQAREALRWWFRAAKRDGFAQRKTYGGTSTSDGPTAAEDAERKRGAAAEPEPLRGPATRGGVRAEG